MACRVDAVSRGAVDGVGEHRPAGGADYEFGRLLQARAAGDKALQATYVRRFTPEYRDAFQAWLKTDPFVNPAAPPEPGYMPTYRNPNQDAAKRCTSDPGGTCDNGADTGRSGQPAPRRQQRADEPEEWQEDPDDEHHPVSLAN